MLIHWLHSVPLVQRIALLIVLIGFIASVFYTLIWNPKTDEIEILKLNILEIQEEIALEQSRTAEFAEMGVELREHTARGNSRKNTETLIFTPYRFREDVMEVAYRFEVPLTLWQPSRIESIETSHVRQFQIEGRFEGGYHQIAQSLSDILQLPWVLGIKYVRLNMVEPVAQGKQLLVANFQLLSIPDPPLQDWRYRGQVQDGV